MLTDNDHNDDNNTSKSLHESKKVTGLINSEDKLSNDVCIVILLTDAL